MPRVGERYCAGGWCVNVYQYWLSTCGLQSRATPVASPPANKPPPSTAQRR